MTNAKGEQLSKNFRHSLVIQMLHRAPAIGGDDFQLIEIDLKQAGDEVAILSLEMLKNRHLLSTTSTGIRTAKLLKNATIVAHPNRGTESIFDRIHRSGD